MTKAVIGGINYEDNEWYPLAVTKSGQAVVDLDAYTNIDNNSIESITGTFTSCKVTGVFNNKIPSDAFGSDADGYAIQNYGYFKSEGSFGISLVCGGYRTSDGRWESNEVAGLQGATALYLDPAGNIAISADDVKESSQGNYTPTPRLLISQDGVQATGALQANDLICRKVGGGYAQIVVLADGTVTSTDVPSLRNDVRITEIQADTQ